MAAEMIQLVLQAAGQQPRALDRDGPAVQVRPGDHRVTGPRGGQVETGYRQACFRAVLVPLSGHRGGVDQVPLRSTGSPNRRMSRAVMGPARRAARRPVIPGRGARRWPAPPASGWRRAARRASGSRLPAGRWRAAGSGCPRPSARPRSFPARDGRPGAGQVPYLLGAHGLDESLGRHPVQGPVQRARAYPGPQLGPCGAHRPASPASFPRGGCPARERGPGNTRW